MSVTEVSLLAPSSTFKSLKRTHFVKDPRSAKLLAYPSSLYTISSWPALALMCVGPFIVPWSARMWLNAPFHPGHRVEVKGSATLMVSSLAELAVAAATATMVTNH